jgi:hypothetical protein
MKAIKADIQSHWDKQDALAIKLAEKHGKKPEWMRARLIRHVKTKYSQKKSKTSAWNAFLHVRGGKVTQGKHPQHLGMVLTKVSSL